MGLFLDPEEAKKLAEQEKNEKEAAATVSVAQGTPSTTEAAGQQGPKKPNKLIFIGAGAAVALIIILILIFSHKETIDLTGYTKVVFDGIDGYGNASVIIDYSKIETDYKNKVKLSSKSAKTGNSDLDELASALMSYYTVSELIRESCSYTLTPSANLKNGDEVTLTWNIDSKTFEKASNGKIKAEEMKFTVSGLEAIKEFDPFNFVETKFAGYSGDGTLTLSNTGSCPVSGIRYEAEKYDKLSNGDEIIVRAVLSGKNSIDDYCIKQGYKPSATEKKIKVEGLSEYVATDLFEGITVKFDGINGIGKAEVDSSANKVSSIAFNISKKEGLSNGDVVEVTVVSSGWSELEDILKSQGIKTDVVKKEYTVEGLTVPQGYNPFDEISLEYSGISPVATVEINTNSVSAEGIYFEIDKKENLAIGDEITVKVCGNYGNNPADVCLEQGLELTETEKKYKVENISFYVEELSQIPEQTMEFLKTEAEDILTSRVSNWDEDTFKSMKYNECYLLTPKSNNVSLDSEGSWWPMHNAIILIYEIKASTEKGKVTFYWPVKFGNLVVMDNGEIDVDTTAYNVELDSFEKNGLYFYGYEKMTTFVTKQLNAKRDVYKSEGSEDK